MNNKKSCMRRIFGGTIQRSNRSIQDANDVQMKKHAWACFFICIIRSELIQLYEKSLVVYPRSIICF